MNILFISAWFPYPPNNGSKLRVFNLLRGLSQEHAITLVTFNRETLAESDRQVVHDMCRDVVIVPWIEYQPQSWRARTALLSTRPRAIVDRFSQQMADALERVQSREQFDVIIASQLGTACYSNYFDAAPTIFEEVELATLFEQFHEAPSTARRIRYGLTWLKHRRYMSRLLSDFQACTVVSEQEREILTHAVNGRADRVAVIPNCVELSDYDLPAMPRREDALIFTGSFTYSPNYEAVCWFLAEVYPHVRKQVPELSLTITGHHADLPLPSSEGIIRTGFVDDVRLPLASSTASIAPIWTGGGTRLKILEAMALHTPVISTSKGAEGLDVQHGEHLLIADTPQDFAEATIAVLRDAELRQRLAANAYALVAECYSWSAVMPTFKQLVADVARNGRRKI